MRRGQRVAAALSVQRLPRSNVYAHLHIVCEHEAAAGEVIPGNLSIQSSQDRIIDPCTTVPDRRELPDRLADAQQS